MNGLLFITAGGLTVAGLILWRILWLRDRHPNTDLVLEALRALGPVEGHHRDLP
jgi:hypothetical protein